MLDISPTKIGAGEETQRKYKTVDDIAGSAKIQFCIELNFVPYFVLTMAVVPPKQV